MYMQSSVGVDGCMYNQHRLRMGMNFINLKWLSHFTWKWCMVQFRVMFWLCVIVSYPSLSIINSAFPVAKIRLGCVSAFVILDHVWVKTLTQLIIKTWSESTCWWHAKISKYLASPLPLAILSLLFYFWCQRLHTESRQYNPLIMVTFWPWLRTGRNKGTKILI